MLRHATPRLRPGARSIVWFFPKRSWLWATSLGWDYQGRKVWLYYSLSYPANQNYLQRLSPPLSKHRAVALMKVCCYDPKLKKNLSNQGEKRMATAHVVTFSLARIGA